MKTYPISTVQSLIVTYNGVRYGVVAQRYYAPSLYTFISVWNQSAQEYLPLLALEQAYVRKKGAEGITPVRSKRAARRRVRQYLRLWTQEQDTKNR